MKKTIIILVSLCGYILLNAQIPFDPENDYLFADFELNSADKGHQTDILDIKGKSTGFPAILGGWSSIKGLQQALNLKKTKINSSSGTYRFGVSVNETSGGIFINLKDWQKYPQSFKSLRFKLFTNEPDLLGKSFTLKVTAAQYKSEGGKRINIYQEPVVFGNDWLEFNMDLSQLDRSVNYQFIDIALSGLPLRKNRSPRTSILRTPKRSVQP